LQKEGALENIADADIRELLHEEMNDVSGGVTPANVDDVTSW
jgi:hypothetical protein